MRLDYIRAPIGIAKLANFHLKRSTVVYLPRVPMIEDQTVSNALSQIFNNEFFLPPVQYDQQSCYLKIQ